MLPAGATLSPLRVPVRVLEGVLVPLGALGLSGLHMGPMLNGVQHVIRPSSPTKVLQPVVQRVGVRVVAGLFSGHRRSDEGRQDESMDTVLPARVTGQRDSGSPVDNRGFDNLPSKSPNPSVCVFYGPVYGTHVAPVRNFVPTFVPGYREPSLVCHKTDSTPGDSVRGHNEGTHYL